MQGYNNSKNHNSRLHQGINSEIESNYTGHLLTAFDLSIHFVTQNATFYRCCVTSHNCSTKDFFKNKEKE